MSYSRENEKFSSKVNEMNTSIKNGF